MHFPMHFRANLCAVGHWPTDLVHHADELANVGGGEWSLARQQLEDDASERPEIDAGVVAFLCAQHFWRHVERCALD